MPEEDFAETTDYTIRFNLVTLRNRKITNANLTKDNYLAASDTKGLAAHETGHIIAMKYGNKGFEIARKAYYNIFRECLTNEDLLDYLIANVSEYSVTLPFLYSGKQFKQSYYKEVLPELLAKNKTNATLFTEECVRLLRGQIK